MRKPKPIQDVQLPVAFTPVDMVEALTVEAKNLREQVSRLREQNLRQVATIGELRKKLAEDWRVGDRAELHLSGVVTEVSKYGDVTVEISDGGGNWTFEATDSDWTRNP